MLGVEASEDRCGHYNCDSQTSNLIPLTFINIETIDRFVHFKLELRAELRYLSKLRLSFLSGQFFQASC